MRELEQLDRRAFLRGMMITSAGLLVPKPAQVFVTASEPKSVDWGACDILLIPNPDEVAIAYKLTLKFLDFGSKARMYYTCTKK